MENTWLLSLLLHIYKLSLIVAPAEDVISPKSGEGAAAVGVVDVW